MLRPEHVLPLCPISTVDCSGPRAGDWARGFRFAAEYAAVAARQTDYDGGSRQSTACSGLLGGRDERIAAGFARGRLRGSTGRAGHEAGGSRRCDGRDAIRGGICGLEDRDGRIFADGRAGITARRAGGRFAADMALAEVCTGGVSGGRAGRGGGSLE
jgi:hypothetical protein